MALAGLFGVAGGTLAARLGDALPGLLGRAAPRRGWDAWDAVAGLAGGISLAAIAGGPGAAGTLAEKLAAAGLALLLVLIAAVDAKHRLVPNAVIYPAGAAALIVSATPLGRGIGSALLGGLFGFVPFLLAATLRPGELGGGDVKLAAFIGLAFGFPHVLWALAVGVTSGGAAAAYLMLAQGRGRAHKIPYAPFLCLGAVVALLYDPLPALLAQISVSGI
jgi:leader peptidase (prepilin peptidase)/N-methyltransferase